MTIPVLYILMRNDLNSLTWGKSIAQGSHATDAFRNYMETTDLDDSYLEVIYEQWKKSTEQGFGTVLVLEGPIDQIENVVRVSSQTVGLPAEMVFDPTYPLIDGKVVHHIPLNTCAFVFVPDKDEPLAKSLMGRFPLHR